MASISNNVSRFPSAQRGLDILLEEIYFLRVRLNELSKDIGSLTHPELVELSQKLDEKLNNYNQLACLDCQQETGLTLMG